MREVHEVGIVYHIGNDDVRQYRIGHAEIGEEAPVRSRTCLLHPQVDGWRIASIGKRDALAIICDNALVRKNGFALTQLDDGITLGRAEMRG